MEILRMFLGLIKSMFSFSGKTRRGPYGIQFVVIAAFFVIFGFVTAVAFFADAPAEDQLLADAFRVLMLFLSSILILLLAALIVRRLNDAGLAVWWVLLLFIPTPWLSPIGFAAPLPFLGIYCAIALGFFPSRPSKNKK